MYCKMTVLLIISHNPSVKRDIGPKKYEREIFSADKMPKTLPKILPETVRRALLRGIIALFPCPPVSETYACCAGIPFLAAPSADAPAYSPLSQAASAKSRYAKEESACTLSKQIPRRRAHMVHKIHNLLPDLPFFSKRTKLLLHTDNSHYIIPQPLAAIKL